MKINLLGRLRNTFLPQSKPLLPLLEAVVNSIHACEEANLETAHIWVTILRDESQAGIFSARYEDWPIVGFRVEDDGIGFNTQNFESFQTADTTLKISKGSRGIGRLLWLIAFEKVRIESTFREENKLYRRSFDFVESEEGVENSHLEEIEASNPRTSVSLLNYKAKYRPHLPKRTSVIAKRIIEHCLAYFLSPKMPVILLADSEETLVLNTIFDETIKTHSNNKHFNVKEQVFSLANLRLYGADENVTHTVHFCANNREVTSESLVKYIPDVTKRIRDEDGKPFVYMAYVSGRLLDERVTPERTRFNLIDEMELDVSSEVTFEDLKKAIAAETKSDLYPFLIQVREDKRKAIVDYVQNKAPQYRSLIFHRPDELNNIPGGLSEDKLELELYKLQHRYGIELKESANEILSSSRDITDEEYFAGYKRFIEQLTDFSKSNLAQYIIHRKMILELFARNLQRDDDGRYRYERDIHEIIFPMRTTSDDATIERQNLWIINETLAFHRYLASDIPLKDLQAVRSGSSDRPDLIIFSRPIVFTEGSAPYNSIVIIEFKRPMREGYNEGENPINQVTGYIRKIKESRILDERGRPVPVTENMPFFVYIICDMTQKIMEFSEDAAFRKTADGLGYFGYNPNLNSYFEVISFDKLVNDAKKRNAALFEKLQLPLS
jgi:hypothetical protein